MASQYAILPRSSIEVVHLPFHRGYRCLCSVTAAHSIRRGMARPRTFRCLFQFRNSFLLSLASGGEERTYTTKHGTTADLKRTVIPLARSFERGRKTGVTAPGEAFAPWHRSRPPSLDRRAVTRHHQTAASPVSRSVQGFKRDDDVRRFRLVKLETSRVVVAPAGKIHDLGRLSRRPGGSLGRLHDVEPVAVEEERVFSEQVVELWNHGVVVGNGPGFELPQSALDLCGREFHCTLPSIGSLKARFARPPTADGRTLKLGHPAALRKVSLHTVK